MGALGGLPDLLFVCLPGWRIICHARGTGRPQPFRLASSIRVTASDGVAVPSNPTGSFVMPDVPLSTIGPVAVADRGNEHPPGTVVTLQVFPQTPTDPTVVNLSALATLVGTLQSSTATATFTFPYGFSRGFVRASWTQ